MAAVTVLSDLEPRKIKSVSVSIFPPSFCHEVIGSDVMILVFFFFLMLSFKSAFSLCSQAAYLVSKGCVI